MVIFIVPTQITTDVEKKKNLLVIHYSFCKDKKISTACAAIVIWLRCRNTDIVSSRGKKNGQTRIAVCLRFIPHAACGCGVADCVFR